MKPLLHKLPFTPYSSFLYMNWECDYFDKPFHFHREFELVLIEQAEGIRFIGDNVSNFKDGDLILIGSNIPHLYKNNDEYYNNSGLVARSTFVHFTKDFLGHSFFDLPEMKQVLQLLDKSSLGIEIYGEAKHFVSRKLLDMKNEQPTQRLMSLLSILIFLADTNELKPILSRGFIANNTKDTARINTVFQFIMENYTKEIYVKKIASELNMSIAAFSRYFKNHTRKTFSDYVTEIRIGHACRLLMENNFNIAEICYLSGFDNLSNFYRHFKKHVGIIPKEYKKRFLSSTKIFH